MKPLWQIRNRRHPQAGTRREAPRLSLFPFLAVLICTMGALVLLLLFVSRQARQQAARRLTDLSAAIEPPWQSPVGLIAGTGHAG